MTNDHQHLDLDRLGDLVDDLLGDTERASAQQHLASCASCRDELARLRALLAQAAALPTEMALPATVWDVVRSRIRAQPSDADGGGADAPTTRAIPVRRSLTRAGWMLAAAVVLVAVTATITTVVVRRRPVLAAGQQPPVAALVMPASARALEDDFGRALRELDEAFTAQRGRLRPETIAKVDASLRVIDDAIVELRRALAVDPANMTLLDILSASYERKLELLRRAAELPASS